MSDHFRKSDRIFYEKNKTCKSLPMGLLMKLCKIHGEEEVVKKLGDLREIMEKKKIQDPTKYLIKMFI